MGMGRNRGQIMWQGFWKLQSQFAHLCVCFLVLVQSMSESVFYINSAKTNAWMHWWRRLKVKVEGFGLSHDQLLTDCSSIWKYLKDVLMVLNVSACRDGINTHTPRVIRERLCRRNWAKSAAPCRQQRKPEGMHSIFSTQHKSCLTLKHLQDKCLIITHCMFRRG